MWQWDHRIREIEDRFRRRRRQRRQQQSEWAEEWIQKDPLWKRTLRGIFAISMMILFLGGTLLALILIVKAFG